jgi:crotonobetainyl-CoA:carnitine CoA-transferase CaiB-like acyl-CoA transferase
MTQGSLRAPDDDPSAVAGSENAPPLAGLHVLELGSVVSAPFAGLQLAEMGADVVKVESPDGDLLRRVPPCRAGTSAYFVNLNRGKRSVVLDLGRDGARPVVERLLEWADVLIENWRPGVHRRLGLDPDTLRLRFGSLIFASVRGFGDDGPYAPDRAYDKVLQGLTGLAMIQHGAEKPEVIRSPIVDKVAGMALVQGILGALVRRAVTGKGDHVTVSLLDTALWFSWPDLMTQLTFLDADPGLAGVETGFGIARARDGRWISYTAVSAAEWEGLCRVIQRTDWIAELSNPSDRARQWDRVRDAVEQWASGVSADEALMTLRAAAVPCGPVNTLLEALDDPQVRHNETVGVFEQAPAGRARGVHSPLRMEGMGGTLQPAPALGEHTDAVLTECGVTVEQIASLHASGVAP